MNRRTHKEKDSKENGMMSCPANPKFHMPYDLTVPGDHLPRELEEHFKLHETIAPVSDVRVTWNVLERHNPALVDLKFRAIKAEGRNFPDLAWDNLANKLAKMICAHGTPVSYTKVKIKEEEKLLGLITYKANKSSSLPISFHTKKSGRPLLSALSYHLQNSETVIPIIHSSITWKILTEHNSKISKLPTNGLSERYLNRVTTRFVKIVQQNHEFTPEQKTQHLKKEEKVLA